MAFNEIFDFQSIRFVVLLLGTTIQINSVLFTDSVLKYLLFKILIQIGLKTWRRKIKYDSKWKEFSFSNKKLNFIKSKIFIYFKYFILDV